MRLFPPSLLLVALFLVLSHCEEEEKNPVCLWGVAKHDTRYDWDKALKTTPFQKHCVVRFIDYKCSIVLNPEDADYSDKAPVNKCKVDKIGLINCYCDGYDQCNGDIAFWVEKAKEVAPEHKSLKCGYEKTEIPYPKLPQGAYAPPAPPQMPQGSLSAGIIASAVPFLISFIAVM